jgi:hypothetical protein
MKASNTVHQFDSVNYVGTDPETRDQTQSQRLHEPVRIMTTIDPITGRDIEEPEDCPHIIDGNVVINFETQATRQAYLDTPLDHPVPLPDNPTEEWVAES